MYESWISLILRLIYAIPHNGQSRDTLPQIQAACTLADVRT